MRAALVALVLAHGATAAAGDLDLELAELRATRQLKRCMVVASQGRVVIAWYQDHQQSGKARQLVVVDPDAGKVVGRIENGRLGRESYFGPAAYVMGAGLFRIKDARKVHGPFTGMRAVRGAGSTLYCFIGRTDEDRIEAYGTLDGKQRWSVPHKKKQRAYWSSRALRDGVLLFETNNRAFKKLAAADGKTLWSRRAKKPKKGHLERPRLQVLPLGDTDEPVVIISQPKSKADAKRRRVRRQVWFLESNKKLKLTNTAPGFVETFSGYGSDRIPWTFQRGKRWYGVLTGYGKRIGTYEYVVLDLTRRKPVRRVKLERSGTPWSFYGGYLLQKSQIVDLVSGKVTARGIGARRGKAPFLSKSHAVWHDEGVGRLVIQPLDGSAGREIELRGTDVEVWPPANTEGAIALRYKAGGQWVVAALPLASGPLKVVRRFPAGQAVRLCGRLVHGKRMFLLIEHQLANKRRSCRLLSTTLE